MAISFRLGRLRDDALLGSTAQIISRIAGHPLFSNPDPPPLILGRQAAALEKTKSLEMLGSQNITIRQRQEREELIRLLRKLGLYILRPADDEKPLFYVSGLDKVRQRMSIIPQEVIHGVYMRTGAEPGTAIMGCIPVHGLRAYLYEHTADPVITKQTKWITRATTLHSVTLKDLTPGMQYQFRMAVIGRGPDHFFCSPIGSFVV